MQVPTVIDRRYTITQVSGLSLQPSLCSPLIPLGKTPHRSPARPQPILLAVMTMKAMHDELRDLHAVRFAEISALREMLIDAGSGAQSADIAGRMRDSVAEILRLQKMITLIEE